jgi:hypothetical protein
MTPISRRRLLGAIPGAVGLVIAGCFQKHADRPARGIDQSRPSTPNSSSLPVITGPGPTLEAPTPTPFPRGTTVRQLLAGTPQETPLYIQQSGVSGPAVMVLGGVHGNEPGAWLAGDEIAAWMPAVGTLLVVPRANVTALAAFVRTFDEIGDLNRLYPGSPDSPLMMERMAYAILDAAREFGVSLLIDMHESWAFYAEYPPNSGTGALGQTITAGVGPLQAGFGERLAERVNPNLTAREQMIVRDGARFARPTATPVPGQAGRGRSSLSAGGHVPGLTPVLVEMGQTDQPVERRVELHLLTARTALELMGML